MQSSGALGFVALDVHLWAGKHPWPLYFSWIVFEHEALARHADAGLNFKSGKEMPAVTHELKSAFDATLRTRGEGWGLDVGFHRR